MLQMEIGACKNAKKKKKKKKKKNQISYLPILSYFWYVMSECIPSPKMQKTLCCNLFWVKVKYR